MEAITTKSLSSSPKFPSASCIDSLSPAYYPNRANVSFQHPSNVLGFNCLSTKLQCCSRKLRILGPIHASGVDTSSTSVAEKWVLEPIGDGDSRHIGVKTARADAFEISSSDITVGRVADRADIVIPVPTVSGVHARIQKTEQNLLITDLDSTNGTFIGDKRLQPGVAAVAWPGSIVTFGRLSENSVCVQFLIPT
ncbi:OLC1v1005072C1 [Oldenlandia corymbosa var. corymbosa]|uniref:OLC1v1005072C1 n=1 Tax=Oldenlandia corymbosa var. corymbosa TaxID=529605 RepID=A0AAV1DGQ6_OLDCO|nr:OLC1v1005072C1 [Oldenlandia corymbosa var. corymbosa]